jgi:hypothetical protein
LSLPSSAPGLAHTILSVISFKDMVVFLMLLALLFFSSSQALSQITAAVIMIQLLEAKQQLLSISRRHVNAVVRSNLQVNGETVVWLMLLTLSLFSSNQAFSQITAAIIMIQLLEAK